VPNKHYQAIFLAPLPGIEEEEAPTSTTRSHVNYAPAAIFLALLPGRKGVSHFQTFTLLLFCFTLFLPAYFYQKYKQISSFDSWYSVTFTFSSLCCSLSTL
jgi:hypothetical protein